MPRHTCRAEGLTAPGVLGAPVWVFSCFLSLSFLDSAPPGSEFCSDKMSKYSNPGKVSRAGYYCTEAHGPTTPAMTDHSLGSEGTRWARCLLSF